MAQSKIITFFLIYIFCGCNVPQVDRILKVAKKEFKKAYREDDLFAHFPRNLEKSSIILSSPPYCPPQYKCRAQFGDFILIMNKNNYQKELSELLNGKIIYKTNYSDENIIINLSELKRNIFPIVKCNKWYSNKTPIPYFESYDFGLGEKKVKKEIDGEFHFNYTYIIPSDLMVYVIDAKYGDFWIKSCNEKRPKTLKIWQHGYSRGFSVSETANIIVYWVIIW